MPEIRLPPRYVNAPVESVYDADLYPAHLRTLLRIHGLYWDMKNPPAIKAKDWQVVTGLSKPTFYRHINELQSSGWLLFSTDGKGVLSFEFNKNESHTRDSSLTGETVAINIELNTDSDFIEEVNHSNAAVSRMRPGKRKKRDALLDHPAVKLHRRIMHLTANHNQRREIAAAIGEADEALGRWRAALEHWSLHGWRPTNVGGMLDSFRNGGAAGCKMCRSVQSQAQPQATDNPTKPSTEELRAIFLEARREQERSKREADDVEAGQNP